MFNFLKKDNITVIGKDDVFEGKIKVASLYVDGEIKGETKISAEVLTIGKYGKIYGDVSVVELEVFGSLQGNIEASTVTLKQGCSLKGDIVYSSSLSIEEGSVYEGTIKYKPLSVS
jgi:cytoskeletal protein CcmA (bactofilin family)